MGSEGCNAYRKHFASLESICVAAGVKSPDSLPARQPLYWRAVLA